MTTRTRLHAFALAATVVLVIGCGGTQQSSSPATTAPVVSAPPAPSPTPELYTISGTFTLIDSDLGGESEDGSICWGRGGFDDIFPGLDVVVRDEGGVILAAGALGGGRLDGFVSCEFPFSVSDVPRAKFYSVEVGSRGDITYSFDELVGKDWKIALTLD